MNIGINVLYLIPDEVGGTQTYAQELIHSLSNIISHDHVYIFCNKENYHLFKGIRGIKVVSTHISGSSRVIRILAEQIILPTICAKHRIDILHSLGYSSPVIGNFKKVVTIHDLNWYFHPEDFSFLNRIFWRLSVWSSAKSCDLIITDSSFSQRSIISKLKIQSSKVVAIPCGTPKLSVNFPSKSQLYKKYGLVDGYLLTVSAQYPHKNLLTTLRVYQAIHQNQSLLTLAPQLIICGLNGKSDQIIKEYIQAKQLSSSVKILGYIPSPDLTALYRNANIFLFTSAYEGFGFPILEAMSQGLPVISSNAASLVELLPEGDKHLTPYDTKAYVSAIQSILTHNEARQASIQRGYNQVKLFTWEKTAKATYHIYQQVNTK